MKLYDYYRSTASYRVRLALNIKNISYEKIPVHLTGHNGEQHSSEYLTINPQGLVPTLDENGHILSQSLAIIEYLDEINPTPPLLPPTPLGRAQVRSMALTVACDMHPLNNLRVLTRLRDQFQASEEQVMDWYHHWLKLGFDTLERKLQSLHPKHMYCYGSEPTLADICLIPQVFNAYRFGFSMEAYPLINDINAHCLTLTAFKDAAPQE
ncbi:maleylacetoacetate isomerase [Legionella jamestowniensis]|uniref:Maleylacetoacetate isomerase n=1 Tax=Legionella jamestowniensis TaxID=455 RepID=A0A0W0UG22_9GAMM|nr:maleylacetoacetate isomerase [Legionella jamestowniensis]KTD06875.1 glutathione S-transferase (maleylacetoacetate isomerase) [Legionella jamestowniensis]OCH97619.1 maleylacetoacetate isomerase [Legionella jamestowniensis]SFL81912.1 maleylacetoacetate isomerase [Legionella jamestowniensis DSM 19215]